MLVLDLRRKMKVVENVFKRISSTANDTISDSISDVPVQGNQNLSQNNQEQNNNLTFPSHPKKSRWTMSSYETSIHVKPVEVKCNVGSILKGDLCGEKLYLLLRAFFLL